MNNLVCGDIGRGQIRCAVEIKAVIEDREVFIGDRERVTENGEGLQGMGTGCVCM